MEFLINWITQIIVFIILAVIIDLLIPATTMKKYIKLVLGLILMLIFLKPLFSIFTLDVNEALKSSYDQMEQEETAPSTLENLIEMEKVDIQASQDAYVLEQMTFQLKDVANDSLKDQFDLEIADINYTFSSDETPSYENLEQITVYLEEVGETTSSSVVEEVKIGDRQKEEQKRNEVDEEGIKKLLQDKWELELDKLSVEVEV